MIILGMILIACAAIAVLFYEAFCNNEEED